jgi:hypothetical protein
MLSQATENGLGIYYTFGALLNVCFAFYCSQHKRPLGVLAWLLMAVVFVVHTGAAFAHFGWVISPEITHWIDGEIHGPRGAVVLFGGSTLFLLLLLLLRRFFVQPQVAWTIFNLLLLSAGWALTNQHFRAKVVQADNIPVLLLLCGVGFLAWFGLNQAVNTDTKLAQANGSPQEEADPWLHLVYPEFLCVVLGLSGLLLWSLLVKAPLGSPATTAWAPNPIKAPWYLLSFQELLLYFDSWVVGGMLPLLTMLGVLSLPYLDCNPKGNRTYTFTQRWFAITVFLFGFLVLWLLPLLIAAFLRGPNWHLFGPFEPWDTQRADTDYVFTLSELYWVGQRGQALEGLSPLWREAPGLGLLFLYLVILPLLLAPTLCRGWFVKLGLLRYSLLMVLLLLMLLVPIKMILVWTLNLKYLVSFPEIALNL